MGWSQRGLKRYYYRSCRVNGRATKQYVGTGRLAAMAAQGDQARRDAREAERQHNRQLEAALQPLGELIAVTEQLARAALIIGGYRQHARSQWRRRRSNGRSS